MKILKTFLLLIFMILFHKANAQPGVWNKIEANAELTKKLDLETNLQARTNQIGKPFKSYIGELGLTYHLPKGFSMAAYYRFIGQPDSEASEFEKFHRYYGELKYKTKILDPLRLKYRLRYQRQFKDDPDGLSNDADYLRNKINLSFKNKSRFEPYVSADLFYEIGKDFDQIRYKIGSEIELTKRTKFDLGIQQDNPVNSSKANQWRIAWALSFSLN
jgi:hypothetical protein